MKTGITVATLSIGNYQPSLIGRLGLNRFALGGTVLALLAIGLAWQWSWLVAIGIAPLLLSAAPCVAMCALGVCMHHMAGGSCHTSNTEPPGTPAVSNGSAIPDQTINQGGMS